MQSSQPSQMHILYTGVTILMHTSQSISQKMLPANQEQYRKMSPQLSNSPQFVRTISTSNVEIKNVNKEILRKIVESTKRKKTFKENTYTVLQHDHNKKLQQAKGKANMVTKIRDILEDGTEQYLTKSTANDTTKTNTNMPEAYRKLAKFMLEDNIIHHTYRLKLYRLLGRRSTMLFKSKILLYKATILPI